MKFEVRMPDGELVGTADLPADDNKQYVSMLIMEKLPPLHKLLSKKYANTTASTAIACKTVGFQNTRVLWTNFGKVTEIPTMVLTQGKKSWLRSQKWFKGLR
jgi:hypothetical protein